METDITRRMEGGKMDNCEIVILNTDNAEFPEYDLEKESLYQIREKSMKKTDVEVSICIQAYNRLKKTKQCVEAVLENTEGNYELILLDNGSDEETFEYFKSINHPKKIVRVTKNIGQGYPVPFIRALCRGQFVVVVSNDTYVTKYWLRNMLNCMKSDESIGLVVPKSTNVSNLQGVYNYSFTNLETFMRDAEQFNQTSDPSKWEERLRLITIAPMYRKSAWELVGCFDSIFVHDFGEDDLCARMRLSGYKMMLAGDTFVHHDHNVSQGEDKDLEVFHKLLRQGREAYKEKHQGLDAWDDILNFEYTLLNQVSVPLTITPNILGIDLKCGHPILTLSNKLREMGIFSNTRYAFTTQAKYYRDLQFVCGAENVECDRIDFLDEYYESASMDYIILGEPVNIYSQPGKILVKLMNKLKAGGVLYFKVRNTNTFKSYLHLLGKVSIIDDDMPLAITVEEILNTIKILGGKDIKISLEAVDEVRSNMEMIKEIATKVAGNEVPQPIFDKLITKNYCFCVKK